MKEISVLVAGSAGAGKSTIARIIKEALEKEYFQHVTLKDDDTADLNLQCQRISILQNECRVNIETLNTGRKL